MPPAMPRRLLTLFTAPACRPLWRALFLLLLAAITWLALSPAPLKTLNTGWDKANHVLAFTALAFAGVWGWWPRPRRWVVLFAVLLAYGGAIEIAQSFLPPREADWEDLLADSVGISLGLLFAWPLTAWPARRD
jgi:VanZ family protein